MKTLGHQKYIRKQHQYQIWVGSPESEDELICGLESKELFRAAKLFDILKDIQQWRFELTQTCVLCGSNSKCHSKIFIEKNTDTLCDSFEQILLNYNVKDPIKSGSIQPKHICIDCEIKFREVILNWVEENPEIITSFKI